ncbi:aggregation-promoting factor C-terminal-like domain-containing protein [Nocardiopsis ganjiahuensis]|uniref:aggregation-promoting factor C-terminal-like domain-containing protein n=1 Tax=Nocardiopsis ganjiahuensis TaxID=239984 RepID=UPI000348E366|nr:lytic transglycosylase domain-containing protein [Nocardiopsis ganjiahuensis]
MLLNRISLRQMSAVGAAAVVAGGMFTVSAFAQTDDLDPRQAASAAVPPEQERAQEPQDEFFASPPAVDEAERESLREQNRDGLRAAAEESVQSASGTGSEIAEPEPEPEPEEEPAAESSGGSGGSSAPAPVPAGSAKEIALQMVLDEGWDADQFHGCLEPLWEKESNWNHTAQNPSSGAYGIPQSLPGDKMASHGSDWQTNPATQISWGLSYIKDRYGNPCGAWSHSQANNWY